VTLGNRNNLLFVEACLEQIEQKKTKVASDNTHQTIEMYWSAILGLQSGQHEPVIKVLESSGASFKDKLWSIFRSYSSNQSILDQIDNKIQSIQNPNFLDEFETFYSDILSL